jgi:alpha-N-acetylglucosamine transferase
VALAEIRHPKFREHIPKWGCFGEKELIKFEAFTLMQYPIVVLLDLDMLVLKPLDGPFDFLLDTKQLPELDDLIYVHKPAAFGRNAIVTMSLLFDVLFTFDYVTVNADMDI